MRTAAWDKMWWRPRRPAFTKLATHVPALRSSVDLSTPGLTCSVFRVSSGIVDNDASRLHRSAIGASINRRLSAILSPPAMPCCRPQTDASACVGAGMDDEGLGAAPRCQKVAW